MVRGSLVFREIIIAIMQLQTTTQALLDFIRIFDLVICAGRTEDVCVIHSIPNVIGLL